MYRETNIPIENKGVLKTKLICIWSLGLDSLSTQEIMDFAINASGSTGNYYGKSEP